MPRNSLVAVIGMAAALVVTACSSSSKGGVATTGARTPSVAATSPSSTAPGVATTSAATSKASTTTASGLSGKWSGRYSGAYDGTFALTWQQSGSKLSGSITLSDPGGKLSLNGTVNGNTITFGTVGSAVITYSGTVSGSSMSGTYQVAGRSGGPWSATKKP